MKRLACLLLAAAAFGLASAAPAPQATLQEQLDRLVREGYDEPERALTGLQSIRVDSVAAERQWWLARGLIEARAGLTRAAEDSAKHLSALREAQSDPMAGADAELVRAMISDDAGRLDRAAEHAQAALLDYERLCGKSAAAPRADCDHRSRFRALQVLATRAASQGVLPAQRQQLESAVALAHDAQDLALEAVALAQLASAHTRAGEFDPAARLIAQANRIARLQGSPEVLARVKFSEARIAAHRGDLEAAGRIADEGERLAREAHSPRLEALFLVNRSDDHVKANQPHEALAAVERALPVARRFHEARAERTLLHNASLARLALHQVDSAKRDFDQVLALWQSIGEGDQATVLREFGDALANAGDTAGALELYHRERKLAADIMARNRESALKELQSRYDREAKQRNIELLERENALKGARIENRVLLQRVWTLLALTLAVAAAFAVLLYLRVRETQRQLERSHAKLRVQSERDALTGLANRRHFQDVMRTIDANDDFEGALLLIDIDHFKHVNDAHGHAAGDEVLVEVARRLSEAVRGDDLVVRWGGEEFLVYAPRLEAAALPAFADRLLHSIAGTPIRSGSHQLAIAASIGHAHFPLAPQRTKLGWERSLNFVDMALYTAKSLGRRRAVCIEAVHAPTAQALREIEQDFERAWTEGQVELRISEGTPDPVAPAQSALTPAASR